MKLGAMILRGPDRPLVTLPDGTTVDCGFPVTLRDLLGVPNH